MQHQADTIRPVRHNTTGVTIHGHATLPHYRAHIEPILDALALHGVDTGWVVNPRDPPRTDPVIVAGALDLAAAVHNKRPIIYVEHGAGQTYEGRFALAHRHPSYSGSNNQIFRNVDLFITPNDVVAGRWNRSWPNTPAVAVGCPKLDRWHTTPTKPATPNLVGWTWHPEYGGYSADIPEAGSAWKHYADHLPGIIAELGSYGISVLGHAHPKWGGALRKKWVAAGAEYTDDPDDLFKNAACLVVDNSSLAPEFAAAVDRPVVWVNSPRWRRDVHHHGRFWEWPEGQYQINTPSEAAATIRAALTEPSDVTEARRRMVPLVYSYTDGTASDRAARAILATVG